MTDPFENLSTLADAGLTGVEDLELELQQPFDGLPDFDLDGHPEISIVAGLNGDRALIHRPTRRLFVDYRVNQSAFRHLKRLPKEGESLHGMIGGRYALFDLIPAILERTGEKIANLHLCTLGFSKQNGADLCGMLDDGHVRKAAMICSHYFSQTSSGIYDAVVPELLKRGARVLAMRTHAKIILARMRGGARFVIESSANLRSCKNVEQFVMTNDAKVYTFYRRILDRELLNKAARV